MAAAVEAPPSPPPSGVRIVGEKPPAPPPPPTSTIHVTSTGMKATDPGPEIGKGPAFESLRKSLRKKANLPDEPAPPAATPPAEAPKPAEATAPTDGQPAGQPTGESTQAAPAATATDGKPGKTNPWKLVDEYKARTTKAESRIVELEKNILPQQDRTTYEKRMKDIEDRNKQLEQHIAYVDYSKSKEFNDKYQVPYESAWRRAMTELKSATVLDPQTQQQRPMGTEDLLELVNQALPDAINNADQKFGRLADYVIERRNEIRSLWDQQREALDKAKEGALEAVKNQSEQLKNQNDDLARTIQETWNKVNQETLEHPANGTYFKPREGQAEWNQRLAKGFELADNAFATNPRDPKLTPAQRADVIARHAAVRNRAAGWGPLKWENTTLKTELSELKKQLAEYKSGEPTTGGSQASTEGSTGGTAMERMMAELRKRAKPG